MARLAMLVSCKACSIQSLLDRRITMRLLANTISGVANIDSTMLAKMGLTQAGETRPLSAPKVSSTKPNSPAPAKYKPVRMAAPGSAL